ncbi:MAG: AsmA-like C-terminal domain-containing protein [Helicobacteraceae bacterium]|nr:AsmA-like C-terminal domain-containing protein [Helicobacteraceae bacterium]
MKRAIWASVKTAAAICVLFVLVLIIALGALFFGVSFEKWDFSQFEVQGVDLSVNPKIVLSIDKLIIRDDEAQEQSDPNTTLRYIRAAFLALLLTDRLEVKSIVVGDKEAYLLYEKGNFFISRQNASAQFTLGWIEGAGVAFELIDAKWQDYALGVKAKGFISPTTGKFSVEAQYKSSYVTGAFNAWGDDKFAVLRLNDNRFTIDGYEGDFFGLAEIDLVNKKGSFEGDATALGIRGAVRAKYEGDKIGFTVLNAEAKSLEALAQALPINSMAKMWIHGNTIAENYRAERFALDLNLTTMSPNISTLSLDALARNANIYFNPKLPSAFAEEVKVTIDKGVLRITANNAEYEGQKINAEATINNLDVDKKQNFQLKIDTLALFDETARDLIAAFGAKIDLIQRSGKNEATFLLKTPLSNLDDLHFKARLISEYGEIEALGTPIAYSAADVTIEDSNITINKLYLTVPNLPLFSVAGLIEADEKRFALLFDLRNAKLLGGLGVSFDRLKTKLAGVWDKETAHLTLDDFATEITLKNDRIEVRMDDLKRYRPYLPIMELLDIWDGKLRVVKEDDKLVSYFTVDIGAKILYKDSKPIERASGFIKTNKDGSSLVRLLEGAFLLDANKNHIRATINGLEVDIEALIDFANRRKATLEDVGLSDESRRIFVFGDKSGVRFKNKLLKSDWFSFYQEGERFEGQIKERNSAITINRDRSDITFRGEKIGTDWVRELSGVKMSGGSWDFSGHASLNSKDVYGVIRIKNATIEEAKLFTNVIALINTLPSLAQFRSPGFTSKGFKIQEGAIEVYYSNDVLYFNLIRIVGINADILAQGSVKLSSGEVDIYAAVQSVKSLSSLFSKIPIIGYLLLGDNKKIENILHISGTIDDPKVESNLVDEVIFYPANVFKRALMLPLKIFE